MLFRRSYFNKLVTVAMLAMLLLVHAVKLLHTHTTCFSTGSGKGHGIDIVETTVSADCGVCSYHLAKDATDLVGKHVIAKPAHNVLRAKDNCCYKKSFTSSFESRGPPSRI